MSGESDYESEFTRFWDELGRNPINKDQPQAAPATKEEAPPQESEIMKFYLSLGEPDIPPFIRFNSLSNNSQGVTSNGEGIAGERYAAVPRRQPRGQGSGAQGGVGTIGGLTKAQTANIIFGEVRSLSDPSGNQDLLYKYMAHTIWNGAQFEKRRPGTAATSVTVALGERKIYNAIKSAVDQAYGDRNAGRIPLPRNVVHFVLQPNLTTAPQRLSQNPNDPPVEWAAIVGPFNNSFTGGGLPPSGVHVNLYYNKDTSVPIQRGRATGYDDN
jgi:hypothetical protein